VKILLANSEPSTHGTSRTLFVPDGVSAAGRAADINGMN
jgi:hypothetical protein